jgi:hypothetical protein
MDSTSFILLHAGSITDLNDLASYAVGAVIAIVLAFALSKIIDKISARRSH